MRLYNYLYEHHWNGYALEGPDPGIRFNARFWRFLKSYLRFFHWQDSLIYAQTQKYWIHNNWLMADFDSKNADKYQKTAIETSNYLLSVQHPEGYWEYPNPEWKGRIAAVEGNYAAIGMLETYNQTGKSELLAAAMKWYDYAVNQIGFQNKNGMLAINYFGNRGNSMIPNNSASALRIFAMLAVTANDNKYLDTCEGMVKFLVNVQLKSGELPYSVMSPGRTSTGDRVHFLCYQYNAFQFLNLTAYFRLTNDDRILPLLKKLATFIASGVSPNGNLSYDCHNEYPEVAYYSTAGGAALYLASEMGIGDYEPIADKAYHRVLTLINSGGGIEYHSKKNYGFLNDRRSYPRYLSMILNHLLLRYKSVEAKKQ